MRWVSWKISAAISLTVVVTAIVVQHMVTKIQIRTIAEVGSCATEGATALRGTITFAADNTFILDDGTGKAELSTCPLWYKRIDLREGDHIIVVGKVMRNPSLSTKTDFVISTYKILHGRRVIHVRGRPGKPPWASYRIPEISSAPASPR